MIFLGVYTLLCFLLHHQSGAKTNLNFTTKDHINCNIPKRHPGPPQLRFGMTGPPKTYHPNTKRQLFGRLLGCPWKLVTS